MLEIQQKDNMKRYIESLQNCILFKDIEKENILALVGCLGGKIRNFSKEQCLISDCNHKNISGIVLTGALQIEQYDYCGNRSILSRIEPLHLFGEAYSFSNESIPVNIVAAEDSIVLFFNSLKIGTPCQNHCKFHITLINNMLRILATKNIALNKKIQCMSKRTTREKLLNYLYSESQKSSSDEFCIPYDRQSLADYLCVERSAMAAEISKLRNEKIIECKKNRFRFL